MTDLERKMRLHGESAHLHIYLDYEYVFIHNMYLIPMERNNSSSNLKFTLLSIQLGFFSPPSSCKPVITLQTFFACM